MNPRLVFFAVAIGLAVTVATVELIRKNRLLERYALLWLGSAILLLVFSVWRGLLEKLAAWLGIYYAPSALFLIALFCGLLLMLHFSTVISRLTQQNILLAQEIALLRERIERLEKKQKESERSAA